MDIPYGTKLELNHKFDLFDQILYLLVNFLLIILTRGIRDISQLNPIAETIISQFILHLFQVTSRAKYDHITVDMPS